MFTMSTIVTFLSIDDGSTLVGEIEPKLDLTQWNQTSNFVTHVVIDSMSNMMQLPL